MSAAENKTALTAQDVADILKIAKNTVYEMIKRGEINSYKVGRKVRFTMADVEEYIAGSRRLGPVVGDERPGDRAMPRPETGEGGFIIGGQDVILDVLANCLARHPWGRSVLRAHIGSYDGLVALYRGEIQAAAVHLWDGDTGEYNQPYVRRLLPGIRALIIRLVGRVQGLYVAEGNPKDIRSWDDLLRPGLTMINREKGAGSRVLLDEHLRRIGAFGRSIRGYDLEARSLHTVVAAVAQGEADVAVGHRQAGERVRGLEFIALQEERYDLVIKKEDLRLPGVQATLEILRSGAFRREFEPLGGGDLTGLGEIVAET